MIKKNIYFQVIVVFIIATIALCYYLALKDSQKHYTELMRHCEVIANDIWNYDTKGPSAYLTLVAKHNDYEYINVFDIDKSLILEIRGNKPDMLEQLILNLGLAQEDTSKAEIFYKGRRIGYIETAKLPDIIYTFIYVILVSFLLCIISIVGIKIIVTNRALEDARENLELRVKQRTTDLEIEVIERKQVEEELRKSETQLTNAMNIANLGQWELDVASGMFTFSDNFYTIFRTTAEEVGGYQMPMDDYANKFMHPEDVHLVQNETIKAQETNDPNYNSQIEHRVIFADGESGDVAVRIYIVKDKEGKTVKTYGVIQDITERKRLQELEFRAGRLEMAGTIAGQVAHDFNNILAPLMAYPEIIRETLPSDNSAREYIDLIEKAAIRIADINQDLLTLGRRGHYTQEIINLNQVVKHALLELKPYPETMICQVDLSDDVMNIRGGSGQLHRVISNLLHNARDAIQDIGQITVKSENYYVDDLSVKYSQVPKGEYVRLSISDTGCGISDEVVQKIFDPFFSTKSASMKRGSGLGMSVVDAVIKDHRGFIDLTTKEGEGTTFYLYLPITRESVNVRDSNEIKGGSESILVVDDDEIQREVSSVLLTGLGYKVSSVVSGEKAIEFLRENPKDIIVLDMVMPGGIDGTETYKRIKEFSPDQKAIITSGFSESDRVLEAQKLGVGAFVKKPLTKRIIANAIRKELDKSTQVSE